MRVTQYKEIISYGWQFGPRLLQQFVIGIAADGGEKKIKIGAALLDVDTRA